MRILGGDVARMGNDQSVVCIADNEIDKHIVHGFEIKNKARTKEVVEFFSNSIKRNHPMCMAIDAVFNPGVADELEDLDYPIFRVLGGARAFDPQTFFNLRSELWWRMYRKFELHQIKLTVSEDIKDRLILELTNAKRKSFDGKIRYESKEEIIKRTKKSPDLADALMYTMITQEEWEKSRGNQRSDIEIDYGGVSQYKKEWTKGGTPYDPDSGSFGEVPIILSLLYRLFRNPLLFSLGAEAEQSPSNESSSW